MEAIVFILKAYIYQDLRLILVRDIEELRGT